MKQYKIKVNNEAQSKEAQKLLKQIGYKDKARYPKLVVTDTKNGKNWYSVVVDLNHEDTEGGMSMSEFKELMAQGLYLDPSDDYAEIHVDGGVSINAHWIKVPDSAKQLTKHGENLIFWDGNCQTINMEHTEWSDMDYNANTYLSVVDGSKMVWQRAKHPEELPFIDDGLGVVDNVNHPNHYASSAIECIDAMEAMLTPEQFIGYLRGNVAKYLWRYDKKNGKEDLSKAIWYLNKLKNMY